MTQQDMQACLALIAAALLALWFLVQEMRLYLRRRDLHAQLRLLDHLQITDPPKAQDRSSS